MAEDDRTTTEAQKVVNEQMIARVEEVSASRTMRRKSAREERDMEVTDVEVACSSPSQGAAQGED